MKSFTAHFYEEGKLVGECTAEAIDWKAGWLGVVKAANDRDLLFDRVDMASVWDVSAAWSPATGLEGHTQCRICGEFVRDNGAADMHLRGGD